MTTFDQNAEIDKFSTYANDWWNPDGKCKPLHAINPLRLAFITDHTQLNGKNVIDIGCGGGILTESLAKAGAIASGVDGAAALIEIAQKHADEQALKINYVNADIIEYAQAHAGAFDTLTCMELLEHVDDPEKMIQACSDLVKPNGALFFSTINRNPKAYLFAVIAAEYIFKILDTGTHTYQKFIKPSELTQMARKAGLTITAMAGMHYNPLTGKYWLNKDVSVNYLVAARKR